MLTQKRGFPVNFLRHGYYWYVTGRVPPGKDPKKVDRKLVEKYEVDISSWERSRRKKAGIASVQYLRYEDWFILLITDGHHKIRQPEEHGGEKNQIRDCRRVPIKFRGYSVSYRRAGLTPKGGGAQKWHAHVRIDRKTYTGLKAHFERVACHRTAEALSSELGAIPLARYAPLRRQLLNILRRVNEARNIHGFEPVPVAALRLRRVPVRAYAGQSKDGSGAESSFDGTGEGVVK